MMSELVRYEPADLSSGGGLRKVEPRLPGLDVSVRPATQDDFADIDALQKSESDGLGFQFEQAIRKRIEQGNLIVAEVDGEFAGYCLGVDRYQKRSELGIIYQIGVARKFRRSLVAATLLQAQFDKSAYGTKLYCCWCKQSLEANRFWEAMGFVPLAFRAAGRSTIEKLKKKGQVSGGVHIFWQKRIRVGDTQTPWWYPYETSGGAMMEGRVVLPLPPEVQWDQATPMVLPGAERRANEERMLESKLSEVEKRERALRKGGSRKAKRGSLEKQAGGVVAPRAVGGGGFGVGFGEASPPEASGAVAGHVPGASDDAEAERIKREKAAAKKALKDAQRRNDPELVAYARELRDRWQEQVGPGGRFAGMIENKSRERYAVGRLLEAGGGRPTGESAGAVVDATLPRGLPRAA
jgi:hypothetical protein